MLLAVTCDCQGSGNLGRDPSDTFQLCGTFLWSGGAILYCVPGDRNPCPVSVAGSRRFYHMRWTRMIQKQAVDVAQIEKICGAKRCRWDTLPIQELHGWSDSKQVTITDCYLHLCGSKPCTSVNSSQKWSAFPCWHVDLPFFLSWPIPLWRFAATYIRACVCGPTERGRQGEREREQISLFWFCQRVAIAAYSKPFGDSSQGTRQTWNNM